MQADSTHRGEMSQDSLSPAAHRKSVYRDPIAQKSRQGYHALSASSVGLELGLSVGIGLLLGWWLDQHLHTQPWLMLLWMVLGLVAGFRGVVRAVKRADHAAAQEDAGG
ncbi:MAG TPA: AtpZ/AtpI family protein [Kofleriaceae bacterium]|nr:AtpZ/AtpI family protein [Kofleriaceae bacterium]